MKTNYFFLLFFLLILMGCSDDKNIPDIPASTEDTYEGVHDLIGFTKETEDFTYGDLTFHQDSRREHYPTESQAPAIIRDFPIHYGKRAEGG